MGVRSPYPGFTKLNDRRIELIQKEYKGGKLTVEETRELAMLQNVVGDMVDFKYPRPRIPDVYKLLGEKVPEGYTPCDLCRRQEHDRCKAPTCFCGRTMHRVLLPVLNRAHFGKSKLPKGAFVIMRPGIYGNPYVIGKHGDRFDVIRKFKIYFETRQKHDREFDQAIERLRQEAASLVCCCAPEDCHGDVISGYLAQGHNRERFL